MNTVALLPSWLDPEQMIRNFGAYAVVGVLLIVFAECGLLLGFFLPGDSLLFTAGLLAKAGVIDTPLWLLCTLISVAAIVGNIVGYVIGRRVGPAIFDKPDSRFFKPAHVARTSAFFERHGGRAIILARFVPIVRTFITVMAGVGQMDARRYLVYSTVGGILWGTGVTTLGYALGNVDVIRNNLELAALLIVAVSFIPIAVELLRNRREVRAGLDAG